MAWKRTEDGISSILKEELQKLGVIADLTPSWATPIGLRKPDLLCRNAGVYPIEAKFTERDLITAIAKVQNDYLKYHKALGIKGGFAILYPEQLSQPMPQEAFKNLALKLTFKLVAMFPSEDPRPFKVYENRLPEIAKILREHVLAPPMFVEPSIDYIIRSLRESALYLLNGLKHLTSTELEGFFGGEDVFKNILQYEKGKYPVEELKLAAAYLLVNQLLFYHVLSRIRPEFPEIDSDKIGKPSDLNQYFERVLDVNYKMVFSYNIVSLIPQKFLQEVRTIINVISGLGTQKVRGDLLGTVFHDLIPLEIRKNVAAFYTNVLAAELLAFLSVDREDSKVADFAVGSGGLLVAAYRRKKNLGKEPFTEETHKRFVQKELLGIDVMPFAANVAACHLALQSPQYFTDKVNMAIWDSTDLTPKKSIPSVAELRTVLTGQSFLETYVAPKKETKGVVSLTRKKPDQVDLETYDIVIMNPPFTRHERIPKEYKRILEIRFKRYEKYLHGQLGYYGYFILLADRFLNTDGKMALVLPASVLRVKSCEGMRKLWSENYYVEYIILTSFRSAFSESTRFREMLFVARKVSKHEGRLRTKLVMLKEHPKTLDEARNFANDIMTRSGARENLEIRQIDYSILRHDTRNWFRFFALKNESLYEEFANQMSTIPNMRLVDSSPVVRGYEMKGGMVQSLVIYRTPAKALKSKDIWIKVKSKPNGMTFRHKASEAVAFTLPNSSFSRTIRRPSGMNRLNVYKDLDYMITDIKQSSTLRRLNDAIGANLSRRFLESLQGDINRRLGNFFVSADFDLSASGTHWIAFYSPVKVAPAKMLWSMTMKDEYAKLMCLFFNSSMNLVQLLAERVETRGAFMRMREYFLEDFIVPDISKLDERLRGELLRLFKSIEYSEVPSILVQLKTNHAVRKKIDRAWLKVFRYKGDADSYLDGLYSSLVNEIEILRDLMMEGSSSELYGEEDEESD